MVARVVLVSIGRELQGLVHDGGHGRHDFFKSSGKPLKRVLTLAGFPATGNPFTELGNGVFSHKTV
jgi:hypothetical protein